MGVWEGGCWPGLPIAVAQAAVPGSTRQSMGFDDSPLLAGCEILYDEFIVHIADLWIFGFALIIVDVVLPELAEESCVSSGSRGRS